MKLQIPRLPSPDGEVNGGQAIFKPHKKCFIWNLVLGASLKIGT